VPTPWHAFQAVLLFEAEAQQAKRELMAKREDLLKSIQGMPDCSFKASGPNAKSTQ
jgi:hypothetical protein